MKRNFLSLSLIMFSAGCGLTGSPSAKSAQSSPAQPAVKRDPCSLLTKEEIAAALGAEMRESHSDDGMHCLYSPRADIRNGASVTAAWGPENVKMLFTDAKRVLTQRTGSGFQDISGLGDEAFFVGGSGLSVRKGDAFFSIGLTSPASLSVLTVEQGKEQVYADLLEKEKVLAIKALARL